MTKESFFALLCEVGTFLQKQVTHYRDPVPVEVRLTITLFRLGSADTYFNIEEKFGVGFYRKHERQEVLDSPQGIQSHVDTAGTILHASCILHNFLQQKHDELEQDGEEEPDDKNALLGSDDSDSDTEAASSPTRRGQEVRQESTYG
ncbi:hypothetical protein R1sor_023932 [Riccia sorocarpa]|uniref:Uncharacterized protein n=1 Tax=Riccia sorocarpa TaxID=122646 RepID=A0ABD3GQL2_9MARC